MGYTIYVLDQQEPAVGPLIDTIPFVGEVGFS